MLRVTELFLARLRGVVAFTQTLLSLFFLLLLLLLRLRLRLRRLLAK